MLHLLLLLACSDKGGESLPTADSDSTTPTPTDALDVYGNAGPTCAPDDGASVVLTFEYPANSCTAEADPEALFRIAVWTPAPLPLGTYDIGDPDVGSGYTGNIPMEAGSITITAWEGLDANANISGHYEVIISGGAVVHKVFSGVPWCPSDTLMCG